MSGKALMQCTSGSTCANIDSTTRAHLLSCHTQRCQGPSHHGHWQGGAVHVRASPVQEQLLGSCAQGCEAPMAAKSLGQGAHADVHLLSHSLFGSYAPSPAQNHSAQAGWVPMQLAQLPSEASDPLRSTILDGVSLVAWQTGHWLGSQVMGAAIAPADDVSARRPSQE